MNDPIVVVGAGLAGLVAARSLVAADQPTLVVDKGRSVGGRLATRRIGGARLDHGAQFFTVRGDGLRQLVEHSRRAEGPVTEWCRGFGDPPDGHPRYTARGGMNALAKWLARDLDCSLQLTVRALRPHGGGWVVEHDTGELRARAVVATAPLPQSLALLAAAGAELPDGLGSELGDIGWFPTLAALLVLDGPSAVPEPGAVQLDEGLFTFVADNHRKGISEVPALTLHVAHDVSGYRWDDEPDRVLDDIVAWARPWLGAGTVVEAQLKRWRYAGPTSAWPEPTVVVDVDGSPIALAGDAFAGPKVEGAHNSGAAAAEALLARLA